MPWEVGAWSQGHQPPTHPCPAPTPPAFDQIGGYEQLAAAYAQAIPSQTIANTTCHLPRADAMHMFRDPYTADLPWTGMTFGLTIMATWYWCTDQVSVNIAIAPPSCLPGWALEGPGGPPASPWHSPMDTCLVSLGWGGGHGLPGSRPRDAVLGVLAILGGLSPPFRIRRDPLATARPGLQVLRLGQFGVRDAKRTWVLLGDPAIGLGAGISGRPWGPGIGQGAGHGAPLDLPGVWACHGRAPFPGRALGAISSGAVPQGS